MDEGEILMDGVKVDFKSPVDARHAGIETVFQTLAVAPALDIASNLYLGREIRSKGPLGSVFRMLDTRGMRAAAKEQLKDLGIGTIQDLSQKVETLSGGQRQASHNMPQVFEVADRIHIQRLGRSAGVITPHSHTMEEAVAIMTGATTLNGAAEDKSSPATSGGGGSAGDSRAGADRTESTGTGSGTAS